MPEDFAFHDLIRRVRAGDADAASDLVRLYEPEVRRTIRIRLRDRRLRRVLDSVDVCQSVLASFFARAALGQFDLDSPDQLVRLLATMARNKLANQANHHAAQCRDVGRVDGAEVHELEVVAPGPSPSELVGARDLLLQLRERLSDDERDLADQRAAGRGWDEIAAGREANGDALRRKLARAVERAAGELGLEDLKHD
jgi:RNA polymerase sigma-70 factor (ECF subfamily)